MTESHISHRRRAIRFCPRGHEYTVENTAIYPSGRQCKQCSREKYLENKEKKIAQAAKWNKEHKAERKSIVARSLKKCGWKQYDTPERKAKNNLRIFMRQPYLKNYGITQADYDAMLERQQHRCKICRRHKSEFKRRLHVDHCHTTKKVRGLLCDMCNTGLGRFRDDVTLLFSAVQYLNEAHYLP
jgi:hypothetical protein